MKAASGFVLSAFVFLSISGTGVAVASDLVAYEGKDAIRRGQGGAKKTVDGIDFWSDGAPPVDSVLLGYISDSRHKSGLVGMVRMSGLEGKIAKEAKKAGGDAVIVMESYAETIGTVAQNQGNAHATSNQYGNQTNTTGTWQGNTQTAAVQKQKSRFAVVKYLPAEDEATDAEPIFCE